MSELIRLDDTTATSSGPTVELRLSAELLIILIIFVFSVISQSSKARLNQTTHTLGTRQENFFTVFIVAGGSNTI